MKTLYTLDAAKAVDGQLTGENVSFTDVTMDSRKVTKGSLFVAIKGEKVDGHSFISDVFSKGAAAVICDHIPEGAEGCFIVVENTVKALQDLARYYRSLLKVKVVGITGSVGKTSTKEIIYSVLSQKFKAQKTLGNYNNEIGLPLTILSIEEDTEVEVLEMGISDFGEMHLLSSIAQPDICVITNIGQSHLEALGTRDGILKAKSEIFDFMNPDGAIFLNGDDDKLETVKEVKGIVPVKYGFNEGNSITAKITSSKGFLGTDMVISLPNGSFEASIGIMGRHNVLNACAAAGIGEYLGMTFDEIAQGINLAKTIAGRNNLIPNGKDTYIVDDCYNAAPNSVKAGLDALSMVPGKKVAILGDMYELGTESDALHREVGEYAAGIPLEKLIIAGENSKHMYEGALSKKPSFEVLYFENLDALLEKVKEITSKDENILVKASNGMNFSKVVKALEER